MRAEGGNFNDWMNRNYKIFDWESKILVLYFIVDGLNNIHQKQMVHHDLHTGNILFSSIYVRSSDVYISDIGLCGEVNNVDDTKIYGVMPYVAPEVLIADCAHNEDLALKICNGIRPEISEPKAPEHYINLMRVCWDSNPDNRPTATKISELIILFIDQDDHEIEKQLKEAEEYRVSNLSSIRHDQSAIHPQATYVYRLLNSYTTDNYKFKEFSDEFAVEQLLWQHVEQSE